MNTQKYCWWKANYFCAQNGKRLLLGLWLLGNSLWRLWCRGKAVGYHTLQKAPGTGRPQGGSRMTDEEAGFLRACASRPKLTSAVSNGSGRWRLTPACCRNRSINLIYLVAFSCVGDERNLSQSNFCISSEGAVACMHPCCIRACRSAL